MKRIGNISPMIEARSNFLAAFDNATRHKGKRREVRRFTSNLDTKIDQLVEHYKNETWKTSEFLFLYIMLHKPRVISKLPLEDHVIQWAVLNQIEPVLVKMFINGTYSCIKGRGTHAVVRTMRKDFFRGSQREMRYYAKMDVRHFYASINHDILFDQLSRKFKDKKLLRFLKEAIGSFNQGLPLGIKMSQLLANLNLAWFDHAVKNCFYIRNDPERMAYWRSRYVSDKIGTARSIDDQELLAKGSSFIASVFDQYVKRGVRYYYRYADDMVLIHEDKTFLHIMTELSIIYITRDLKLEVKSDWRVSPVAPDGIDFVGYVFHHDHVMARKRNKQALCRQVAKLKKKGYTDEEIRLKSASRLGFVGHADTRNLFKKLNMQKTDRLGKLIRKRRKKSPFEGLDPDIHKRSIEDLIYDPQRGNVKEDDFLILLLDYKIDDSILESKDEECKKRIAIRYRTLNNITLEGDTQVHEWSEDEYYSFSGSKIMIEQATNDFSHDDLPIETVIQLCYNDKRKKFYKFT